TGSHDDGGPWPAAVRAGPASAGQGLKKNAAADSNSIDPGPSTQNVEGFLRAPTSLGQVGLSLRMGPAIRPRPHDRLRSGSRHSGARQNLGASSLPEAQISSPELRPPHGTPRFVLRAAC